MSRIVRFEQYGGPEVLKIFDEPLKEPGPGEVRLKVEAIGLNRAEVMLRTGKYVTVPEFPARIGIEAAGVVDAIGAEVTDISVGEHVSAVPFLSWDRWGNWIPDSVIKYGVYGDSGIVPAWTVARNPEGTSATDAAAAWCQYLTAWGGLIDFAHLNDQSIVVVSAASSSAALGAIQIAKSEGALTIAATRTLAKRQSILKAGADYVIVTDTENFVERVKQITDGQGFTIAYDPVGGPFVADLIAAAMPGGIIVNYGNLSSENVNFYVLSMLAKRLTIKSHSVFDTMRDPEARERGKRYVVDGMRSGALRPIVSRTFPLTEIVAAHRYMESNEQIGKIVVVT
jgi:NADPH:quinone reductase-like Zn-dependent oxidoreductase